MTKTHKCDISGTEYPPDELYSGSALRKSLLELIRKDHPNFGLASIQAPIIMMSQNRKEARDRLRSENDYKINLKAELEIRVIHEKLDHLVAHQNQKMLEIQEIQADFLEDIMNMLKNHKGSTK